MACGAHKERKKERKKERNCHTTAPTMQNVQQ